MSLPVLWTTIAVEHLEAIVDYVGAVSPVYALRLADRILAHADRIGDFPEAGRRVPEAADPLIREVFEGPYRIMYLVQPSRVDLLAIVHGRQQATWPAV